MEECIENGFLFKLKQFLKGMVFSIVITIIMLFILAGILCFTQVGENIIIPSIIFISAFSILIGSFIVMKKIKEKGLIYGILVGLIYMCIIYLISSFISMDFSLGIGSIIMIIFGILSGAIGGIIGVNVKI